MSYTATYSPDDNKLRLYSVGRLPTDVYQQVRSAGFIWAPKQGLFVAPMWTPDRADLLLELCGEIGDEDTSLADRAEERAERFQDYRENRAEDAQRARSAVSAIADNIPLGQPILVGHHSERHARKDAERIENGMRRAIKLWETSEYWKRRAAGALHHAKYKELPRVRANRIKTLEADRRRNQREQDEARSFIRCWGSLNSPRKGELIRPGVYADDPAPVDDALRLKRALAIANYSRVSLKATPDRPYGASLWSELEGGRLTPRQALLLGVACHARQIARTRRWIAHLDNRLLYERAMLEEQGATDLLKPKGKSAKALLPLCNYRAPDGVQVQNIYNRGELMHYPQIDMTAAEYARINVDYKGTRVVDNSHRIRTTMQRHSLVCVFLTDSKVHERPAAVEPTPKQAPPPRPIVHLEPDTEAQAFDALRGALKAGIKVVSAPQLFPTPPALARRMVELADLRSGDCVLEPSAGTGNLIRAVLDTVDTEVLAYEINADLCAKLSSQFPSYKLQVRRADFLEVTDFQGQYPRILMNPPFERGSDIRHILHARKFLAPGGRLVAICGDGPRQREALQPIALSYESLPAGSFSEQGSNVNTALVVLDAEEA